MLRTNLKLIIKNHYLKRITINKFIFTFIFSFAVLTWGSHVPGSKNSGTDLELTTRIMYVNKNWTTLFEASVVNQFEEQQYRSILLGQYYRFHPNIRTGLFYKRQSGFRHDEDWVTDPVTEWKWKNTNNRHEDLVILDLSPKFLLSFLPGEDWSFEFKTRFEHNFFNSDQNLRLMPTLTYHWILEEKPFLNFYIQQEQAMPLNYSSVKPNEEWLYFGMLYGLDSNWQLGMNYSQKTLSWKNTPEFEKSTGATYTSSNTGSSVGLLVIYKIEK